MVHTISNDTDNAPINWSYYQKPLSGPHNPQGEEKRLRIDWTIKVAIENSAALIAFEEILPDTRELSSLVLEAPIKDELGSAYEMLTKSFTGRTCSAPDKHWNAFLDWMRK